MKSLTTLSIRYSLTGLAGMTNRKRLLVNVLAAVFVCAGPMMDSRSHGQDQDAPAPAQVKFLKGDDVGGGAFTPSSVNGQTIWVETSDKTPDYKATFTESVRTKDYIIAFDATRNLYLALPLAGGMCKFSNDRTNWNDLCKLSVVALDDNDADAPTPQRRPATNRPAVTDEPQSQPAPKPKLKKVAIYPWGQDPQPLSQVSTELITITTTQRIQQQFRNPSKTTPLKKKVNLTSKTSMKKNNQLEKYREDTSKTNLGTEMNGTAVWHVRTCGEGRRLREFPPAQTMSTTRLPKL